MKKQFDPKWPFPQYDEEGNRLLPDNHNQKEDKSRDWPYDIEDAPL